ncbi:DUF983 domain-containing protein [Sphingomonas sabuli]|uniref:DUF983 domain-containing protein n=1 Tax=Sphingomonas sabuli TaxID=2764186 RepID=A0A7G9KZP6_9SPHN|nr:DUF983 domain-containing protein [Sphingomonas sabuli]QNM81845.1 DUF983 domain-containing protein [Sphingomonas sabuli]
MREVSPVHGALAGLCPRCKSKTLFDGWISFAPKCRACGLDYAAFNVGDGPAAFLILIVGAILTVAALVVDGRFAPPWWVHIVWLPVGLGLTVFGLRAGKALLLTQEYRQQAREGRIADQ